METQRVHRFETKTLLGFTRALEDSRVSLDFEVDRLCPIFRRDPFNPTYSEGKVFFEFYRMVFQTLKLRLMLAQKANGLLYYKDKSWN